MKSIIVELNDFDALPDTENYKIDHSDDSSDDRWFSMQRLFLENLMEFLPDEIACEIDKHIMFDDYHYEYNRIHMYIYGFRVINSDFVYFLISMSELLGCFFELECYDDGFNYMGNFSVSKSHVVFDRYSRDRVWMKLLNLPHAILKINPRANQ